MAEERQSAEQLAENIIAGVRAIGVEEFYEVQATKALSDHLSARSEAEEPQAPAQEICSQ